jgi:hypothetical protein
MKPSAPDISPSWATHPHILSCCNALLSPNAAARTCRIYTQGIQHRSGRGKVNITLERKFLGVIYYTLTYNWVFGSFPNYVLASLITGHNLSMSRQLFMGVNYEHKH